MSGKILIVDELATNRIVLKVKLSSAYYDVLQAKTGADALRIIAAECPDLILASAKLTDFEGPTFIKAVRKLETTAKTPVVLILPSVKAEDRIAALSAGADDVLCNPLDETFLLARLRSLLRQGNIDKDLRIHAGTAHALGFAEVQGHFQRNGRVALVSRKQNKAMALFSALSASGQHAFVALNAESAVGLAEGTDVPDVFILGIDSEDVDDGLRLLAELKAARRTRNCPIIAILEPSSRSLAATVLDMGANDVMCGVEDLKELLLRLSNQMHHKHMADQMRDQLQLGLNAAVIDPLTGVHNRRYALPFLKRLIDTLDHETETFAVMVADLDHFKNINDTYGHAAGDQVLKGVASQLRASLREDDMLARIGGEEFLIVTPNSTRAQARQTASRLCRIIQRTPISVPGRMDPIGITISIGVTMAVPGAGCLAPTVESLLDQADRALYGSKAHGRNTVTVCALSAA
ncbi:Response regulator PleD [Roseovarius litorisediminis]|uniref:diguanylate cyclase n=1 Tax=Roseovarius litorisediminis TaxID=1312363 RepID=A0A1Y5RU56_9RHOB|nr:diguanylate cyclase [Roseovarius litorisediminis]SLN25540.1 Response regulator PleD [Roseovarius litorisediminis]